MPNQGFWCGDMRVDTSTSAGIPTGVQGNIYHIPRVLSRHYPKGAQNSSDFLPINFRNIRDVCDICQVQNDF